MGAFGMEYTLLWKREKEMGAFGVEYTVKKKRDGR
jgi:hypothetical protein